MPWYAKLCLRLWMLLLIFLGSPRFSRQFSGMGRSLLFPTRVLSMSMIMRRILPSSLMLPLFASYSHSYSSSNRSRRRRHGLGRTSNCRVAGSCRRRTNAWLCSSSNHGKLSLGVSLSQALRCLFAGFLVTNIVPHRGVALGGICHDKEASRR